MDNDDFEHVLQLLQVAILPVKQRRSKSSCLSIDHACGSLDLTINQRVEIEDALQVAGHIEAVLDEINCG